MQPISSSGFRNNNKILDSAKILPNQSWEFRLGKYGHEKKILANVDVIDINNNGKFDVKEEQLKTKFWEPNTWKHTITEPNIKEGYKILSKYASAHDTEVITQDDVQQLVKDGLNVTAENTCWKEEVGFSRKDTVFTENQCQLSSLVKEMEPFEKNAKWAIDFANQEFLVYRPQQ